MEVSTEDFKAGNFGSISHFDGWDDGDIVTEFGIVSIMADHKNEYVRFDFGWNGRHHVRVYRDIGKEKWSDIKLKKRALKFAREIAANSK